MPSSAVTSPPRVDVNLFAYNAAPTVIGAIESVLAQSWPNLVLTLIDDGSTDATADIFAHYAARNPAIRLKHNRANGGAIANFQRAFWFGDSDFVLPKSADDLLAPDFLARAMSVFAPAMVMDNIVTGSVSVFSAAIANGAGRIVFCSSMARYGTNQVPFLESYTPRPQDPYGIAKVAAEQALANLATVHGCEYAIAVPHNIIGARQKFDDPYRNVAAIMANLMLQGRQPFIYGDGEQSRCFSHIDDCLSCLLALGLGGRATGEVVNIGPDEQFVTINHLFRTLKPITGFEGQAIHLTDRPQEVKHAACSSQKARTLLGYRTTRTLEDGLTDIVEHIRRVGPRKFRYHLDIEIRNDRTPRTWTERLM